MNPWPEPWFLFGGRGSGRRHWNDPLFAHMVLETPAFDLRAGKHLLLTVDQQLVGQVTERLDLPFLTGRPWSARAGLIPRYALHVAGSGPVGLLVPDHGFTPRVGYVSTRTIRHYADGFGQAER